MELRHARFAGKLKQGILDGWCSWCGTDLDESDERCEFCAHVEGWTADCRLAR